MDEVATQTAVRLFNYGALGILCVVQAIVIVVLWRALEKHREKQAERDEEATKVLLDVATGLREMIPLVEKVDRGFEFIKMWNEAERRRAP